VIREAIRLRSAMNMVVYGKALALSSQTKSTLGSGHILNLATTDANRLLDLFYMSTSHHHPLVVSSITDSHFSLVSI
jgi:hypothetical protein